MIADLLCNLTLHRRDEWFVQYHNERGTVSLMCCEHCGEVMKAWFTPAEPPAKEPADG